jgi:glycosidase
MFERLLGDAPQDPTLTGVGMQVYLRSFGGLKLLRRQIAYFTGLEIDFTITSPVGAYDPENPDGPYAPLFDGPGKPFRVSDEIGGEQELRATNTAFREARITTIPDLVLGHIGDTSDWWQRALAGDREAQDWFRIIDPGDLKNWRRKVNIFNYPNMLDVPGIGKLSSTFYPPQIELDNSNPTVLAHHVSTLEHMHDGLLYSGGGRGDAIAYAGGRTLTSRTGEHDPLGLDAAAYLRRNFFDLRPGTVLIAEAGGIREQIAVWLMKHRAHWAYDFGIGPIILYCIATGDWTELRKYLDLSNQPIIDAVAAWILFLRLHDELQLRYVPKHIRDYLIQRFGGPDGRNVIFGGNGLSQRLSQLTPTVDSHIMALALIILLDGVPVIFPGDLERRQGAIGTPERWPARDAVPHQLDPPLYGWPELPTEPVRFGPDAAETVASELYRDRRSSLRRGLQFIQFRNRWPAIRHGGRHDIRTDNAAIYAFGRTYHEGDAIVLANASGFGQGGHLMLDRWPTSRLVKVVLDPNAYSAGDPNFKFEMVPWVSRDPYWVGLDPYEVMILLPY